MLSSFVALAFAAVVLVVVFWRGRGRRTAQQERRRFDTTLGDFHDMREALRPLAKARIASRREPQGGQ